MKLLALLIFPLFLSAAPGTPISIFLGKMTCYSRLVTVDEVQSWCIKGTDLVVNLIQKSGPLGCIFHYDDLIQGETSSSIDWTFFIASGVMNWEATYQIGISAPRILAGTLAQPK